MPLIFCVSSSWCLNGKRQGDLKQKRSSMGSMESLKSLTNSLVCSCLLSSCEQDKKTETTQATRIFFFGTMNVLIEWPVCASLFHSSSKKKALKKRRRVFYPSVSTTGNYQANNKYICFLLVMLKLSSCTV